ncbi:hypothetical protein SAY87_002687 [Trapa incisa]|uniref:C2H2-type domain-containing protein n=1 Tax=Trapa incisa TaxID=236973 RepID=A0AAN7K020_9MYRT|nr:hypothetical protein SAY87_002687 [Trapa incisa]
MKRSMLETDFLESMAMASCLISLSQGREPLDLDAGDSSPSRVFECKTCNRKFPSFQALGGHRASHKKPRLNPNEDGKAASRSGSPVKPKTHECTICGLEFAIGQALGGHMRRHRVAAMNDLDVDIVCHRPEETVGLAMTLSLLPSSPARSLGPVLKKPTCRRVLCLDLNLTPWENDLEFGLGKPAPPPLNVIDCFL